MSATPTVAVTIGDRERTLRYTNRAIVKMEDALRGGAGHVRTMNVMVWAGLLHEDPKLSIEQVIDMLDPAQYEVLSEAAVKALAIAQGTYEEQPEGNAPATG